MKTKSRNTEQQGIVCSDRLYSTQEYCDKFFGVCPTLKKCEDELRNFLDDNGYSDLWDYPLSEVDEILEHETSVVLVDTSYINDKSETIQELRWFEIPTEAKLETKIRILPEFGSAYTVVLEGCLTDNQIETFIDNNLINVFDWEREVC